jgi:hypothetical protein
VPNGGTRVKNFENFLASTLRQTNLLRLWTTMDPLRSVSIPDLDGAIEFIDKYNKLRTTLCPASNGAISNIPGNCVASQRDLSYTFTPVSRSEVKQVFRAVNQNSAVGCDRITYASLTRLNSTNPDIIPPHYKDLGTIP